MYYLKAWKEVPETTIQLDINWPKVSVLIPVRNEAENIASLLHDILAQDYPSELLEIIVINDHSTDNTAEIVASFSHPSIHLLDLESLLKDAPASAAFKKRAIEAGIHHATGEWIFTTDGDCRIQPQWIKAMLSAAVVRKAKLVTGPVLLSPYSTDFEKFQSLDFMGMIGITAASLQKGMFNLANGANLLYEKKAFLAVDGYKDIDHSPSGDDMLLVYKIAAYSDGAVAFAKDAKAIVSTAPMHTMQGFLQQRFRWTSKSTHYQDKRITAILGLVYLSVLWIPINLLAGIFWPPLFLWGIFHWALKSVVDYYFLKNVSDWYGHNTLMKTFFRSQWMHVLYIIGVGTLGNVLQYKWKGRKLK